LTLQRIPDIRSKNIDHLTDETEYYLILNAKALAMAI
jgi:hypothetical protein